MGGTSGCDAAVSEALKGQDGKAHTAPARIKTAPSRTRRGR